jgi:hypothetical protein
MQPTVAPYFIAPDTEDVIPQANGGCAYRTRNFRLEGKYDNFLGAEVTSLPTNWGFLGTPVVEHYNTEVEVRVANPYLLMPDDAGYATFPVGNHLLQWEAAARWDWILDSALPIGLFFLFTKTKYGKAFFELTTDPKTAKRAAEIGLLTLINLGVEAQVVSLQQLDTAAEVDMAENLQSTTFNVLDVHPPTITASGPVEVTVEATDFGGERWFRQAPELNSRISASDPCGLEPRISNDAPDFLPLGTTRGTWTARDTGALAPGNPGFDTVYRDITVADTRPPILLAPPSRVIESASPASTSDFDIGTALVFDLADPEPELANTAPTEFPVDERREVRWTATDASGNQAVKSQWITVKRPNSNNAPTASNVSAEALTSEVIDLELTGWDPDILSGRRDPLKFSIVEPPANGFFVSPLTPYFIEDFRVKPTDEVGQILQKPLTQAREELYDTFCANGEAIPTDFVHEPEQVFVNDDNESYVLDLYWLCGTDASETLRYGRLGKWSESGDLLNWRQLDTAELFEFKLQVDREGFVYLIDPGDSSSKLFMARYDADLASAGSWRLDPRNANDFISAKRDATTGLIYATDKRVVEVFNGNDGNFEPAYVGSLAGGAEFLSDEPSILGDSWRGYALELDSTGAIYAVDSGDSRIYKFEPPTWNGSSFTAGELIGWLGRCDSGANCDNDLNRSIGYSCTASTCNVSDPAGNGEGQFDLPLGVGIDPKDILYATDYRNARVQRFTPLGDPAGIAQSTCDGTCFVLGDMGRPRDIAVNASKFFVLDRDRDLMHVFETAPFKDITEDSVIVAYASDNSFQGTDTFRFRANDGLVSSNTATATITVTRAFRPPVALTDTVSLDEDTQATVQLAGTDPDGIAGVDFNGLDTLTVEVLQGPANGSLSGTGEERVYTPNADFYGEDQIVFQVSDGVFDSEPATITLAVNSVNDPPVPYWPEEESRLVPKAAVQLMSRRLKMNREITAPLGFPMEYLLEYADPDPGQAHFLAGSYGDGNRIAVNQNPPADPENPTNDEVITPTIDGVGIATGSHVYTSPGDYLMELLVIDAAGAGANADDALLADVTVVPMVDLTLEGRELGEIALPGTLSTLEITVTNERPVDPVIGLAATQVQFTGTAPEGAQTITLVSSQGTCRIEGRISTCDLGSMANGEEVTLFLQLLTVPEFDSERIGYLVDVTSAEPDATGTNQAVIEIPVESTRLFESGFED